MAGLDKFAEQIENVGTTFKQLAFIIKYFISRFVKGARKVLGVLLRNMGRWLYKKLTAIGNQIRKIGNLLYNNLVAVGTSILDGLGDGIRRNIGAILGFFVDIFNRIVDAIRGFLGISSPSTIFMEIGGDIIRGLVAGIRNAVSFVWNILSWLGSRIIEMGKWIGERFLSIVSSIFNFDPSIITDFLGNLFDDPLGTIENAISSIISSIGDLLGLDTSSITDFIGDLFDDPFGTAQDFANNALAFIEDGINQLITLISGGKWDNIKEAVVGILTGIFGEENGMRILRFGLRIWDWIRNAFDTAITFIRGMSLGSLKDTIVGLLSSAFDFGSGLISDIRSRITGLFTGIFGGTTDEYAVGMGEAEETSVLSNLIDTVLGPFRALDSMLQGILDREPFSSIMSVIDDIVSWFSGLIPEIDLGNLTSGLTSFANLLEETIGNVLSSAWETAKSVLDEIKNFDFSSIPVIGGLFGGGASPDISTEISDKIASTDSSALAFDIALSPETEETLKNLGATIVDLISQGITDNRTNVMSSLLDLATYLVELNDNVTMKMGDVGRNMVQLMADGMVDLGAIGILYTTYGKLADVFFTGQSAMEAMANEGGATLGGELGLEERFINIGMRIVELISLGIEEGLAAISELLGSISVHIFDIYIALINHTFTLSTRLRTYLSGIRSKFVEVEASVNKSIDSMIQSLSILISWVDEALKKLGMLAGARESAGVPDNIPGRAGGGIVLPGQIYEFNERRRNIPFEIFQTNGKNYLLASQPGYMHSPANSRPLPDSGGSSRPYVVNESYEININGSNLDEYELQSAVREAIHEERIQNPPHIRFARMGV